MLSKKVSLLLYFCCSNGDDKPRFIDPPPLACSFAERIKRFRSGRQTLALQQMKYGCPLPTIYEEESENEAENKVTERFISPRPNVWPRPPGMAIAAAEAAEIAEAAAAAKAAAAPPSQEPEELAHR